MSSSRATTEPVILLQTKLNPPPVSHNSIHRPRLLDQLNQGLDRKLTLITAPAGYGKTTLVSQWLTNLRFTSNDLRADAAKETQTVNPKSKIQNQIAWLSLDEQDNNLLLFVHYLVAATHTARPDSCLNTLAVLQGRQPAPWAQLATILANDLAALPDRLILVLDDYHFVAEQTIHQLLSRLLDYLPAALHLVLISRTELPLALARLRVRWQLNELRAADLSFSSNETEQYLAQAANRTLAPETVSALQARSEGWVAGLVLATLSLQNQADEEALVRQLQASRGNILDYLFTEVLAQQEPAVQQFLLQTSILNRFSAPLGRALMGEAWLAGMTQKEQLAHLIGDSRRPLRSLIEWLERHHLFVIALDDQGEWYRYHHLFQLMLTHTLRRRLSAGEIAALHRRASAWLAQEGLIDEALQHALAADDVPAAVQLIEQNRLNLMTRFDYHTLERWLALLPETAIEQRPILLLLKGWINVSSYRMADITTLQPAQQAEACLEKPDLGLDEAERAVLQGEIAGLRSVGWFWRHDFEQTLRQARQALAAVPLSYVYIRAAVVVVAAFALQGTGQPAEAINLIRKELQHKTIRLSLPGLQVAAWLPLFYYMAGQLRQAVHEAQNAENLIQQQLSHDKFISSALYRSLGFIHYEWNDLDAAGHYLRQVDQTHLKPFNNSQLSLAWLYEVQGQSEQARQLVDRLHSKVLALNVASLLNEIESFQARRLWWQGRVELALHQLDRVKIATSQLIWTDTEVPPFTQARVLIAHNSESSWQQAEALLQEMWSYVEQGQVIPRQIEVLALQALLYQRQGRPAEALATLEKSVRLAKPGGFIRTFVDLGPAMAGLLYQLLAQGVETEYLGQILAAFPPALRRDAPAQQVQQATQAQLIEPLTERESEILLLLNEGLSNKLIARELDISPLTVKKHTINIYQKLEVNSRKKAVARARALGILAVE